MSKLSCRCSIAQVTQSVSLGVNNLDVNGVSGGSGGIDGSVSNTPAVSQTSSSVRWSSFELNPCNFASNFEDLARFQKIWFDLDWIK